MFLTRRRSLLDSIASPALPNLAPLGIGSSLKSPTPRHGQDHGFCRHDHIASRFFNHHHHSFLTSRKSGITIVSRRIIKEKIW